MHTYTRADEDLELAVSLKRGKQQSLAVLYDKYAPALTGIITRIIKDESLVEKVLNNSFVKAWNQISAFNPSNNSLFSWLINIARQTAFEEIRSGNNRDVQKNILITNNAVYKAQKNGSGRESAFELIYYKGLNYLEAATVLHITLAEVKTSIRTTLENMKKKTIVK